MQTHLSVDSFFNDKTCFFFLEEVGGGTFLKGKFMPAFRQIKAGQRTLSISVDSQLPLVPNNP